MQFLIFFFSSYLFAQTPTPLPTQTPFVKPVPAKGSNVTDWDVLSGLDLKTHGTSESLKKILDSKVKLLGFMVPLDYDNKSIKEFLLIPTPLSCTHVPPPAQNQMVLVKIPKGKKAAYSWGPVYTTGKLFIPKTKPGVDAPGFEMVGDSVEFYKAEDGSVKVHNN